MTNSITFGRSAKPSEETNIRQIIQKYPSLEENIRHVDHCTVVDDEWLYKGSDEERNDRSITNQVSNKAFIKYQQERARALQEGRPLPDPNYFNHVVKLHNVLPAPDVVGPPEHRYVTPDLIQNVQVVFYQPTPQSPVVQLIIRQLIDKTSYQRESVFSRRKK